MRHSHVVIFIFFVILFTAGIIYIARRTAACFSFSTTLSISFFLLVFISVVAILSSNTYIKGTSPLSHILTLYCCYTAGFLLYLLFATLLIHLISLFVHFPLFAQGVASYALTIVTFAFSIFSTSHVVTTHHAVALPKIEKEFRIAHLSDIHLGHFRGGKWLSSIVSKVNNENPDVVVITGDLFESFYNLKPETLEPLSRLKAPVLFVTGNHDGYVNVLRIKSMATDAGLKVLDFDTTVINGVQFIGIPFTADPDSALPLIKINHSLPSVLLYHYPKGLPAANTVGISLVLAGHTHAGQFFPITLINHFAFQYNSGMHRYPDDDTTSRYTYIYTSDGVGTTGPPLRFGTFSEISIITLTPQ